MLFKWLYRCTLVIIILLTLAIVSRIGTGREREKHAIQTTLDTQTKATEIEAKAAAVEANYAKEHQ